jgi:uncharacterized protein (DUF433 family)
VLYSFRDLVALRTVVFLRAEVPLQRVRKAFANLPVLDFTEHPSHYTFGYDNKTIGVLDEDGRFVDLVADPGQARIFTLAEVFAPFSTSTGHAVVDFRKPRKRLEVHGRRLGGWPTIEGTRVGFDSVAKLVVGGIEPEDVRRFYPTVSAADAKDAADLYDEVERARKRRAA